MSNKLSKRRVNGSGGTNGLEELKISGGFLVLRTSKVCVWKVGERLEVVNLKVLRRVYFIKF